MTQIRAEINQITTTRDDRDVLTVTADEVRIEHEAILRRAWIGQGAPTRLKVDRRRQAHSYIGFLHEHDGAVALMPLDQQNTDTITHALVDLTLKHPDKNTIIVA